MITCTQLTLHGEHLAYSQSFFAHFSLDFGAAFFYKCPQLPEVEGLPHDHLVTLINNF